jgi:predicted SAM-dependent methyltransferase
MRDIVKAVTTTGVRRAARNLAAEFQKQRLHRASLKRIIKYLGHDLRLNIGCGQNLKTGWVNIDLAEGADLQLDLRERLPFPEECASVVYSEHFFEHLDYPDDSFNFLSECFRVLQPGGLFSVGVPDTEWPLKAYVNNEKEYFQAARQYWHPSWCNTRMHNVNYHFRQGGEHKYAYDFETLAQTLDKVGFVSIMRRDFNPGLDSEWRKLGTLYVDAIKPGALISR